MTAGIETLKILIDTPNFTDELTKKTSALVNGLKNAAKVAGVEVQIPQAGSMVGIFFSSREVTNYDDACAADQNKFKCWFKAMLERGIYLAPSQFETLFMSSAHTDEDIARTIDAAKVAFR
ncbi:MAG: aspartate aminotransferase family protein, partial [Selenomonadaceae bacterium]|nr:aspartate aminotransferase family protein [Selenomonadaceae bacterium]